jgi:DNA polymerase V
MPTVLSLPFFANPVSAGFPSPCEDFYERSLDLNTYLVPRPATTFFMRVARDMTLPGYTLHKGAIGVSPRPLLILL